MGRWIRRHRRVAIDVSNGNGSPRLRDISVCGVRAQSHRALRIDDTIDIALPVRGGELVLQGRVVRARRTGLDEYPYEYGIELGPLAPEVHEQLLRFMDQHGIDEEPTTAVESTQLQELRERIGELEQQLEHLQLQAEQAADADPARQTHPSLNLREVLNGEETEQPCITSYDMQRFTRLLRIGQPLIPMVEDPAAEVSGRLQRTIAEVFAGDDCIDLLTIRGRLRGSAGSQEEIINALFACYENNLIDFA